MNEFPLSEWFDLSKPISKSARLECGTPMALYAFKDGLDADGPEVRKAVSELNAAVKTHNQKFVRQ